MRYVQSPASVAADHKGGGLNGHWRRILSARSILLNCADALTRAASRARPDAGREVCAKPAQALSKSNRPDTIRLPACRIISKSYSLPFRKRKPPEIPPFGISGGFAMRKFTLSFRTVLL